MIFKVVIICSLAASILGLSTMCHPDSKSKNYHKQSKTAKHGKTTKSRVPTTTPEPVMPNHDKRDLTWISKYDELLSKHGDKLTPPKKPGDRDGITVQGSQDIVSPKVQKDFEILNALDKQKP